MKGKKNCNPQENEPENTASAKAMSYYNEYNY